MNDLFINQINVIGKVMMQNYIIVLLIILILGFGLRFIKESLKARIRGEKAKDVIQWYMDNKRQSETNDENMHL